VLPPPHLTIEQIRTALRKPLPGPRAQATMAPRPRLLESPSGVESRKAGVLLLLYPLRGDLHLPLTVRTPRLEHHSGQVSLPGGGREEGDASLQETALREAQEEIGVNAKDLEIAGHLTPLYISTSRNTIYPFVACTPQRPDFRLDAREVAELLEVPLSLLLDPATRREEDWPRHGAILHVPFYAVGQHKIWGATAAVLAEFLALLAEGPRPTP
jgi:8-oxo-dGTP pyrophosphatase MutT (NUDIX family)